jgi:5-methyltetrahydrofolate--homocysteine methyltransferase
MAQPARRLGLFVYARALMPELREVLHSGRVLLMDGAMGTELQRAGLRPGECHELWNLTRPERVAAVHRAYVEAGAECLLTNTFQANLPALARHGLADRMREVIEAGVALARTAAGPGRFVLADLGPVEQPQRQVTAAMLRPMRAADGLLVETCSDLETARAVLAACRAEGGGAHPPVLLSLTYLRTPEGALRTFAGLTPEEGARLAAEAGVAALGVNCGREMHVEDCAEVVRRYRAVTGLPLFARPNAGTPTRTAAGFVYPRAPQEMAAAIVTLPAAGARLVGGCCGMTPEHLRAWQGALRA